MGNITKELHDSVKAASQKFSNDQKLRELEAASEEFKILVSKGIAKERGYNLASIEDIYNRSIFFNERRIL